MKIVLVCTNENARRTDKIFFSTKSEFMKSELHKKKRKEKETKITKRYTKERLRMPINVNFFFLD